MVNDSMLARSRRG